MHNSYTTLGMTIAAAMKKFWTRAALSQAIGAGSGWLSVPFRTLCARWVVNKQDYDELGLSCARVCKALDRGLNQGRIDELSEPVLGAIGELTT